MALLRDMLFGSQQQQAARPSGGGQPSPDKIAFGRQVYDFFLSKGMAPHQAAAIAGNMAWEGGGRSDAVAAGDNQRGAPNAPHSIGIAQWNGDRALGLIDHARKQGIDIPQGDPRDANYMREAIKRIPLPTQLEFAHNEMQGPEGRAGQGISGAGDLRGATAAAIGYHRPAGWTSGNPEAGHGFSGRLGLADQIMRRAQASPQPSDGMDDATYRGAPTPDLASPAAAPKPSGGLLASLFGDEAAQSFKDKGLLGGLLPEGLSQSLGQSKGGGGGNTALQMMAADDKAEALKAQQTPPAPMAQAQPPKLDMSVLQSLVRRRGMLGTAGV